MTRRPRPGFQTRRTNSALPFRYGPAPMETTSTGSRRARRFPRPNSSIATKPLKRASLGEYAKAYGWGCVLARSISNIGGPETDGGFLATGEFDFSIGLRHPFSFRHFVGDVEQKQRIQMGNQVMNKINLLNFNLDYQVSRRFSFQIDAPLLLASRRSNNSPYTTSDQGIGDIIVSAQGWVWNPAENTKGNVAFT